VKSDAVIKVPREAYDRAKAFASERGRELRVVTAVALDEYVAKEEQKK
jgi:hypothetical protein